MKKKLILLNSSINMNNITGIEETTFLRSRVFEKYFDGNIQILSVKYNSRIYEHFNILKKRNKIAGSSELLNLYTYYQNRDSCTELSSNRLDLELHNNNTGMVIKDKPKTNDSRIFNEKEEKVLFVHRDSQKRIKFINSEVKKKNVQRDWYDELGYLSKTEIFDPNNDQLISDIYYKTNGQICITKHYGYEHGESVVKHINLYSNGIVTHVFQKESDFIAHWLNEILDKNMKNYLIMERSANYYQAIKKVKGQHVYKIGVVHASHLVYGKELVNKSPDLITLNSQYKPMLEELNSRDYLDKVIVFTRRQLEDIKNRFGDSFKLVCIPNMSNDELGETHFDKRENNKIVMLARYGPVKQHDSAVRVMKHVINKKPEVVLELYGSGPEKKKIEDYVEELGLSNNIKVNGFVENTSEIYNKSSLFILTSLSESFSLTILEALSHGVPCIAYNIRYGPDAMIKSGINGYLVKPNDEKEMASKIIKLLNDKEKLNDFSKAAYESSKEFSKDNILEMWLNLFDRSDKKDKGKGTSSGLVGSTLL